MYTRLPVAHLSTALKALLLATFLTSPMSAGLAAQEPNNVAARGTDATQVTKPIYPWKTENHDKENESGKKTLSHCSAKNMYDNGILLLIAENTERQRRLALHFPQDKLNVNDTYDLQWQVDRLNPTPIKAIAATPRILAVAINDAMTMDIARGNMLFLRGPNDTLAFDLRGVYDAIISVQNCLTANGADTPTNRGTPPVAPVATAAPPPSMPPAPQAVDASNVSRALITPVAATAPQPKAPPVAPLPATTTPTSTLTSDNQLVPMLQGIFTRANLKPQRLVVIPEKERQGKPFDAIWTLGHLFVGVKTERPVPHQALMQIAATYTGRLQQLCGGEFLAEAGEIEKRATHYVMPVEVACSPAAKDGKNTVAALLFALDANALRITFVEAPEKYGSQAIQGRDRISAQYK
jgi:hypothetical protein